MNRFYYIACLLLLSECIYGQNTLDNLGLSSSTPASVAYSLRQLSTSYTGFAIKVRRASDNAEATVAFDASLTPKVVSASSTVTLVQGVTLSTSLGTSKTGSISSTSTKTGTITIVVNKTGNISWSVGSATLTGSSTLFTSELAVGDQLFNSSNVFIGIVKSIESNTSLTLTNYAIGNSSNTSYRIGTAKVTGSSTSFTTEFSAGDRIFNTSHTYLGTISSISNNTELYLNSRDATAASGISFEGTTTTITGSGTSFSSELNVGDLLISNNVTLGIIQSISSNTELILTSKSSGAVSGSSFKSISSTMTFSSFYSGTTVYISTWYDQSGNSRDAIQYLTGNQPRIVTSGTLNTLNGKPTIEFASSITSFLRTSSSASWLEGTLYTLNKVSAEKTSFTSGYRFAISTTGGSGPINSISHFGYRTNYQLTLAQYGNDMNVYTSLTTGVEIHTATKKTTTSGEFCKNGTSLGALTFSSSNLTSLGLLSIGLYTPTSNYYEGSISEITYYASALSSTDRSILDNNQISYYNISTVNWTGAVNTDWTVAGNWSNNTVPTSTSPAIVVIPNVTNKPVISGTSSANSIVINSGSSLTVTGTLQLFGALTNNGTFTASSGTVELCGTISQCFSSSSTIYNLIVNNSSNVTLNGHVTVSHNLTFASGKLSLSAYTLNIGGIVTNTASNGIIGGTNANINITSGSGTTPELQFDQNGTNNNLKNLTISGAGGMKAGTNFQVVGVLNLAAANQSSTVGSIDMSSYTLTMGSASSTIGTGDVTGIVKRTSFTANTTYSFGNQYTTMTIAAGGTLPSDVTFTIYIGAVPSWKSAAIQRYYKINQTSGTGTTITLSLHYLDAELNSNNENNIVTFDYHTPSTIDEHGKASQSTTNNYVTISNRNITYFDNHEWSLSESTASPFTWVGTPSTDWRDANNWTGGVIPIWSSRVIIPNGTIHPPTLPDTGSVKSITIQAGGTLNGGTGTNFKVYGSGGAWINYGTFNKGTSTVVFYNSKATISETTDFYNLTISSSASLTPESGSIVRISGTLTNNGTLIAALLNNTIEYNGSGQTIINPNGLTPGYYNLILNTGTKTMPATALNIGGNLTISGISVTGAANISVDGTLEVLSNGTFSIGSSNLLTLNGDLSIASGSTLNGGSTSSITIDSSGNKITLPAIVNGLGNLVVKRTKGVDVSTDLSAVNVSVVDTGIINILPGKTLTVTNTLSNSNGRTAGIVIKSDATGTGNLITTSSSIAGTVNRYLTGSSSNNPYHFISSPINSSPMSNILYSGDLNAYRYDESNTSNNLDQGWISVTNESNMTNGEGYAIVSNYADRTLSFAGILNTGTINYSATFNSSSTSTSDGWNLIGNPYPCALNIFDGTTAANGFLSANSSYLDPSYTAVYLWDNANGNRTRSDYATYNNSGGTKNTGSQLPINKIAVGQGFFVKVSSAQTLSFTASQKTGNNSNQFFIPEINETKRFWFDISNSEGLFNEILIAFSTYGTKAFDPGYDAVKLKGNPDIALYSLLDNQELIIQTFPSNIETTVVPIGFEVTKQGEYTLNIPRKENFDNETVYLKDNLLNKQIDLCKDSLYTFTSNSGIFKNRFELIFKSSIININNEVKESKSWVNCIDNQINIETSTINTTIKFFDLNGKLIQRTILKDAGLYTLESNLVKGLYLLEMTSENITETSKIFIK